MLNNSLWPVRQHPYRHVYVENVFTDEIYRAICSGFDLKSSKATENSRVENYDAIIEPLQEFDRKDFFPLLDYKWLDLISKALGLITTFEVDAAIHSHPAGSRTGWVHNDYNPGWFARAAKEGETIFSFADGCKYRNGYCDVILPEKICRMRYLTMIFYLNNNDWSEEHGGMTGIYTTPAFGPQQHTVLVPPKNNSLLLFECTPHSWHTFMTTTRRRNSITLWLHRSMESARKQWPNHDPVYWS